MSSLNYATPFADDSRPRPLFARGALQLAHRSLSLALILLVIGVAATAAGKTATPLLLWAFGAGDVALLGGFLSLASDRRRGLRGKESLAASFLAAGVSAVALLLFFVFRLLAA